MKSGARSLVIFLPWGVAGVNKLPVLVVVAWMLLSARRRGVQTRCVNALQLGDVWDQVMRPFWDEVRHDVVVMALPSSEKHLARDAHGVELRHSGAAKGKKSDKGRERTGKASDCKKETFREKRV